MTKLSTLVVTLFLFMLTQVAIAANPLIPAPPQLAATGYLLVDAQSGEVLIQNNADQPLPPASLTKLMTSYIAAVELDKGNIKLTDQVRVSIKAWQAPGSRMFIKEGTFVSLEDLLRGIIIQSGNDASIAVAEHIAGSEEAFADLMNKHAVRLGMNNSLPQCHWTAGGRALHDCFGFGKVGTRYYCRSSRSLCDVCGAVFYLQSDSPTEPQ